MDNDKRPLTYLLPDPQHEYATELMAAAQAHFGLKPVCIYLNKADEQFRRPYFQHLRQGSCLEHLYLEEHTLKQLASYLQARYQVVGMMPYFEQSLVPMTKLAQYLDLNWNAQATLLRFRDKFALKSYVAQQDPTLQLGQFCMVSNAQEAFAKRPNSGFVIKPIDGFANREIGFFNQHTRLEQLQSYFEQHGRGTPMMMEEQFIGEEYAVNGQIDAAGEVWVINVIAYQRRAGHFKQNHYYRTTHVPTHHPHFAPLKAYAQQVMRATGLRRAPFHMEVMQTSDGPRLIEVAARLGGIRYAFMANDVHGGQINYFAMAAHGYLSDKPYGSVAFHWDFYNQVAFVCVDGICEQNGYIFALSGIEAIQQCREFRRWVIVPQLGNRLRITQDLYSIPYSFHLMSCEKSQAQLLELAEQLESCVLKINQNVTLWQKGYVYSKILLTRVQTRLRRLQDRLEMWRA